MHEMIIIANRSAAEPAVEVYVLDYGTTREKYRSVPSLASLSGSISRFAL